MVPIRATTVLVIPDIGDSVPSSSIRRTRTSFSLYTCTVHAATFSCDTVPHTVSVLVKPCIGPSKAAVPTATVLRSVIHVLSDGSRNFERGVHGRTGRFARRKILLSRPLPVARNALLWPCAVLNLAYQSYFFLET